MGAAKPGSTLPTQGGKAQPTNTLQPGSQIFGGTVTPNTIGPNGLPVGGTMPAGYNGPIPSQGGKFPANPQQPTTSNIPGYAQPYVNALTPQVQPPPGQQIIGFRSPGQGQTLSDYNIYGPINPPSNTGLVPAQGGKAPLTPEQQAAISANADPARGLGLNLGSMLYGGGGQQPTAPAGLPLGYNGPIPGVLNPGDYISPGMNQPTQPAPVMPAQPQRDLGYGNPPPRPQVMPRPVPQVMPRQPTPRPAMPRPSLIGSGLAGLRGRR